MVHICTDANTDALVLVTFLATGEAKAVDSSLQVVATKWTKHLAWKEKGDILSLC